MFGEWSMLKLMLHIYCLKMVNATIIIVRRMRCRMQGRFGYEEAFSLRPSVWDAVILFYLFAFSFSFISSFVFAIDTRSARCRIANTISKRLTIITYFV